MHPESFLASAGPVLSCKDSTREDEVEVDGQETTQPITTPLQLDFRSL
jgi:hypothetical protein